MAGITYSECYRECVKKLGKVSESAVSETLLLFEHCFNMDRIAITVKADENPDEAGLKKLNDCVAKRLENVPVQYIIGKWNFRDLDFLVGDGVLIPRPETEMLVDFAIEVIESSGKKNPVVYDLCSGSGCIAISVAKKYENAKVVAFEKSDAAIEYLKKNAALHKADNLQIVRYDIFDGADYGRFPYPDLIISNPPYVPGDDIKNLEQTVQKEPKIALDGGVDGLDFYRCILKKWLEPIPFTIPFAFEFGIGQSEGIRKIFENYSESLYITKDFNGIDRMISSK